MGKNRKKENKQGATSRPFEGEDTRETVSCVACGSPFRVSSNYTGDKPYCRNCRMQIPRTGRLGE